MNVKLTDLSVILNSTVDILVILYESLKYPDASYEYSNTKSSSVYVVATIILPLLSVY